MKFPVEKTDRLDRVLRSRAVSPWMGRQAWDAALAAGWVRVNDRIAVKPGETVSAGSTVEVALPPLGLLADSTPAPLKWRSPDGALGVFEKAVGFPTYPLLPWEVGTLANGIAAELAERNVMSPDEFAALADPPVLEGGLLQRLDRDTSGLVTVAFTKEAKALYRKVFSGQVNKGYLALLTGLAPTGEHAVYFGGGEGKVNASLRPKEGAKPATLKINVLAHNGAFSLVEVSSNEGLRHVVRAGAAALGAPLAGDALYGGSARFPHHLLHAHRLRIPGFPEISSPLPQSFLDCVREVGLHYSG